MNDTARTILRPIPPIIAIIFATYILTQGTSDRWCIFALGGLLAHLSCLGILRIYRARNPEIPKASPPTRKRHFLAPIIAAALILSSITGLYFLTHQGEEVEITQQFRALNPPPFEELKEIIENENAPESSRITAILILSGLDVPRDDPEQARALMDELLAENPESKFARAARSSRWALDWTQDTGPPDIPFYSLASIQGMNFFIHYDQLRGRWARPDLYPTEQDQAAP
jgi:hypothetical protein